MNLARLVFFSSNMTVPGQIQETIQAIVHSCNEPGLTGTILFNERYFLQSMEGSRVVLSSKLGEMYKDPRQKDLTILSMASIPERRYPAWLVAFAARSAELQALYVRFGSSPGFEPPMLSPENAEGLLSELWRTESRFITKPKKSAQSPIPASQVPIAPTVLPNAALLARPPSDTFIPAQLCGRPTTRKLNS